MQANRGIDGPRERPAAAGSSDPRLHHMRGLTKTYDKSDRPAISDANNRSTWLTLLSSASDLQFSDLQFDDGPA
jgi:hypothetical protein